MPLTVLLTAASWWPTSAHVALSLASSGFRVAAVYPAHGHPLAKTLAVAERYVYRAQAPLESLEKAIRESRADIIVPCDDRAVSHLHRLHASAAAQGESGRSIADLIERSLGSPASFPIVGSRGALLRSACAAGISVPKSAEVVDVEELRQWSESVAFPWVMKMDGSWGGLGVQVVHSLDQAEECVLRMREPLGMLPMLKRLLVNRDAFWMESWRSRQRPRITVQAYIAGRPANCVVLCRQGKMVAGIAVEVVTAQSATGPATVVRVVEGQQMLRAAETLAGSLSLSGYHGLDFILEEKTGIAYLIELNPRCAMPCHIRLGGSQDLSGALYRELTGEAANPPPFIPGGDILSYFPQAWLLNPRSPLLQTDYHDVPWSEPELLRELLLLPWPDRSLPARTSDRLRKMSHAQRSSRAVHFQSSQGLKPAVEMVDRGDLRGDPA